MRSWWPCEVEGAVRGLVRGRTQGVDDHAASRSIGGAVGDVTGLWWGKYAYSHGLWGGGCLDVVYIFVLGVGIVIGLVALV